MNHWNSLELVVFDPNWGSVIGDFRNGTFPDQWIERDGSIPYAPHSLNITLGFFGKIYQTQNIILWIVDVKERMIRIAAVCTVTENILKKIWREVECCLDILRTTKWAHAEIFWGTSSYEKIFTLFAMYLNNHM